MLKEYREKAGLTQAELASLAGLGQPAISKIEAGSVPSLPTALAIFAVLKKKRVKGATLEAVFG